METISLPSDGRVFRGYARDSWMASSSGRESTRRRSGPMRRCSARRCASATTSSSRDPRTIDEFRAGRATAIPLLHPGRNRLAGESYDAAGTRVDLTGLTLPHDPNGLPMHGNLFGAPFEVLQTQRHARRRPPRLRRAPREAARVPVPAHAHRRRAACTRRAASTSSPRSSRPPTEPVPISFGWHPFVQLPNAPRAEWELRWPACEHVEVDDTRHPHRCPHSAGRGSASSIARTHLRRSLRARARPLLRDLGRRGPQPAHAHAAVRPRVSVRPAVRPARPRVRRHRTDDRGDRRARARARPRRRSRRPFPGRVQHRDHDQLTPPTDRARSRRADAGVR